MTITMTEEAKRQIEHEAGVASRALVKLALAAEQGATLASMCFARATELRGYPRDNGTAAATEIEAETGALLLTASAEAMKAYAACANPTPRKLALEMAIALAEAEKAK